MTYKDGKKFEGSWKGGLKHGYGKMVDKEGNVFNGRYKNGKMHGLGEMVSADGKKSTYAVYEKGVLKTKLKKKKYDEMMAKIQEEHEARGVA